MVNRLRSGRLLFAAFVVLALAGLYGAAGLRHPAQAAGYAAGVSGQAAVTSSVEACAAPGSGGVVTGSLAMAAMPGSASAGTAVVTRLVPGGSSTPGAVVASSAQPGQLHVSTVSTAPALAKDLLAGQPGSSPGVTTQTARGGVMVNATGAMAQGLAVEQTGPGGLVTAQCGSPGTSFWFIGPGQATAGGLELYLMNTDSAPADAQVTAVTDATKGGPILENADNGINVPPHSMVVQSLTDLLQSSKVVALNVSTSYGRVVAALRETSSSTDDGSWLPAAQAPSRSVVIPGLPSVSGNPELYVAVPGANTATVKVTVVTPKGSYQPTGGTNLDLLGGSANEVPFPALAGVSGAVIISSNVPIVAGMLESGGPAGTPGVLAVSAGPVQEQGVLADSPAGAAGSADVVLSAPGKAASVRVVVAPLGDPASSETGTVVDLNAGASAVVPIKAPSGQHGSQLMVVVTPQAGSGPVYAGWTISSGGSVQSILPVPSSLTWIPLAPVHLSLTAVAP